MMDDDARIDGANGFDGFLKMLGSSIAEVIASHGGDDDVAQFHATGGLGDAKWLIFFEGIGFRSFNGAESTGAGAFFPCDHESCRTLAPAFPAVRALSFFADGDEFEVGDQ